MNPALSIALSLLTLLVTEHSARAEASEETSFRSYLADLQVSNGESKTVELQVSPRVDVARFGDPEVEYHGHHDYRVIGKIMETGKSCSFGLLIAQKGGPSMSHEELLKTQVDRNGTITLCSGLILEIASVRSLLTHDSLEISLRSNGLSRPIGKGTATFQGIKTLTDEHDGCADRYHCPPHHTGPRR
jgi:hypothetical protein